MDAAAGIFLVQGLFAKGSRADRQGDWSAIMRATQPDTRKPLQQAPQPG
jgi:hypothetical protein